ncbi:hypothetical protein SAMN05661010_02259 [Modicisalibacter muralis]|uniref:Chain length determinant protein n=1 Tax=Modicisalibacter muralis TaxID=119000 RepID=A0A1G9M1Y2_9GAMM|nr:hypothetical protein [Halomonas muralis]SDL68123.1 hypothetical protein SAMN05661010_02259 [Halomonas muralis]
MPIQNTSASDEISLVQLAVILVKRWKVMLTVFLLIMLATIAFIVLRPASYTYTSVYAIAEALNEEGELVGLEMQKAVLAKLDIMILPAQVRAYLNETGESSLPFSLDTKLLENTLLISLTTQASPTQAGDVEALHRRIVEALANGQAALFERKRASLERRLSYTRNAMRAVDVSGGVLVETAAAIERELDALQKGEVEQVAVRSLYPQGTDTGLIVALGVVLGLVFAIVGAFACHFVTLVRQSFVPDLSPLGDVRITKFIRDKPRASVSGSLE